MGEQRSLILANVFRTNLIGRTMTNHNHRESPFWERESPVRAADYSASAPCSMLDERMAI